MDYHVPDPIARLRLPKRGPNGELSVVAGERELDASALEAAAQVSGPLLNLTYADTHRFPPASWVLEDFVAAARGGGMTYTPYRGDASVRERVAVSVSAFLGVSVDPDRELMLTPGTQGGLFAALAATIQPGETALVADPDYISDERTMRFLGAQVEHVPLRWEDLDPSVEPTLAFDELQAALARHPRVLLFSHPNNPTGVVFPPSVIQRIAELVREKNVIVVVDELYSRLVYDERPFTHLIAEAGMKDRCITLLGPSKTESMSGFRVGVAVGPAALIDAMEDIQSVTALRAPAYAQHTLVRWLAEDHDFVRQRISDYRHLRDLTVARLTQADAAERVHIIPAQGTAYMFPRVLGTSASDQEIALQLALKASVIVNPSYQFGPGGARHFRICFAQDEAIWEQALDRIVRVLTALPATEVATIAR